jgi:N-acetylmuramate 1-kinase
MMLPVTPGAASFDMVLDNEAATHRLAVELSAMLRSGDVVALSGGLGAGKTSFARALIRHLAGDAALEVPSPTFTLVQAYALPRLAVVHADFYRVADASELAELGLDDADALTLVEWPERALDFLRPDRLDIVLTAMPGLGANYRHIELTGQGAFAPRIAAFAATRRLLAETGLGGAPRTHMQGDASTRSYERLVQGERRAILMNAPRRTDGPPVRDGLPYSAIAHLAEDVRPFVALARALRDQGLSAPEILAADLGAGVLILEDLGSEPVAAGDPPAPIEDRYGTAVDVLAHLHGTKLPEVLPVGDGGEHRLPPYDLDALLIEAELLLDWYVPHRGGTADPRMRVEFLARWREVLTPILAAPATWVLRDYHSPNLLWLGEREGLARIGLLDFQDALSGPAAYDVVSLAQDARVDVPETMEIALLGRYVKARLAADPEFEHRAFAEHYAILGAQRATKILGIFARLDRRDGKPQYLRHLPRIWGYLSRSLGHAGLAPLRDWYQVHVPPP